MDKPFPAYTGSGSFVFVCYAHRDAERVYSDLCMLRDEGINIWYDEGIPAGTSWRGEIANAIQGASKLLLFISKASLDSSHCLREVDYALNLGKEVIPVYLEDVPLPPELALVLNRLQALFREKDSRYEERLRQAIERGIQLRKPLPKTSRRKSVLATGLVVAIGLAILSVIWRGEDAGVRSGILAGRTSSFDLYLDGMQLLSRWDKEGNLEDAISLFQQSLARDPEFALGYARLADAQRLQYILTRSQEFLDQAVENADIAVQLNPNLGPVQVIAGRLQQAQGNYDLAFAALEKALAIDPNDAMANQAIASLYQSMERLDDAFASYEKAIALDPQNVFVIDSYANALYNNGYVEEASAEWRKVVSLAPDHFGATLNLGVALEGLGNASEAIVMYERAKALRPSHYLAYANIGTLYATAGRYEEALSELLQALTLNDSDWLIWGNLGYLYSWMDEMEAEATDAFESAISLATAAIERNPRSIFTHAYLALYFAKTGQEDAALERLDNALALDSELAELAAIGAEVFEVLGYRERALEMLNEAIDLGYPPRKFRLNPEFANLLADDAVELAGP